VVDGWAEVFAVAGVQLERLEPAQVSEWHQVLELLAQEPAGGDPDTDHWLLELQVDHCRLWLLGDGLPRADWHLPANRNSHGLDPHLAAELERRRRFWNQHRQPPLDAQSDWQPPAPESGTGQSRASRWWLYGDPDLLARLQAPLADWLGQGTVKLLEQPGLANPLGIRLSGLQRGKSRR
jgi:hypothetical protein